MTQTAEVPGGPHQEWAQTFFGVVVRPRTWLNVAYLLLAFPLGLFYFILLVVGLSVGISLVIIWVGIPILLGLMLLWRLLGNLERAQARGLLGIEVESPGPAWKEGDGFWAKIKALLASRSTWLDLLFLLVKFPLGIVSFVLLVTAAALVGGFISAPVLQAFGALHIGAAEVDSWLLAIALVPVGVLALFVSLHVLNGWAWVSARLAEALLSFPEEPERPVQTQAQGWPQQPPQGWPQAQGWPQGPVEPQGIQQAQAQGWPQAQPQGWLQAPVEAQGWPQPPAQQQGTQPPQGWPQAPVQPQGWSPAPTQPQAWPQQPQTSPAQPQQGWAPYQQGWPQQPPQGWPQDQQGWPQQPPQGWPQQPPQGWPQQQAPGGVSPQPAPPESQGPQRPEAPQAPEAAAPAPEPDAADAPAKPTTEEPTE